MMSLKSRLTKHCIAMFNGLKLPPSKESCFKVLYHMFQKDQHTIEKQYQIWKTLNQAAMAYSTADSRKVHVDLQTLDQMQDFESGHNKTNTHMQHHDKFPQRCDTYG